MFVLENYFLLNLVGICSLTVSLLIYLGRFDTDDPRTGAFQRMLLGALSWAFFDLTISHLGRYHSPELAFDAYRYLSIFFLLFVPAAGELILSLMRPLGWRQRAALYAPFGGLYLAGLLFPDTISAMTFGVRFGAAAGALAPWNLAFKLYTTLFTGGLLLALLLNARAEGDPVARREKLVLWAGGSATLLAIIGAQAAKVVLGPEFPWMANLATVFTMLAAFWSLTRYGRVLSTRVLHRAMVGLTPNGMVRLNGDRITWANPAMARLAGVKRSEALVGRPLSGLLAASSESLAAVMSAIVEGRMRDGAIAVARSGGPAVDCLVTSLRFVTRGPAALGTLAVFTDISALKNAEREKHALEHRLAQARKMEALGLLAGGVAHDLNNVLSGIVSYPDLLLMDLALDSPLRAPVEIIRRSGQKAADIVQDMLTLARRSVRHFEPLKINTIVAEYLAAPEHANLMEAYPRLAVTTQLAIDLPAIDGVAAQLRNILMNLVRNSAEAIEGGGSVVITTAGRRLTAAQPGYTEIPAGDYVVLEVVDDGVGIPPEDLGHIFEPFYTRKVMGRSGTGLGMAVVWGAVEDHRGYIDLSSQPGNGTRIGVYLPVGAHVEASVRPAAQTAAAAYAGNGERVLVVDDMAEQREMAVSILGRLGYRAESVASGEAAVARLNRQPVDLVVLDMIMLPGIDGLETYRRIRRFRPGQPAVIASGFAETDRVQEAIGLGAGPSVRKPYTVETLGLAVRQALHRDG